MTIDTTAAVALACEQALFHHDKAAEESGDSKRAHLATMNALTKAASEMLNGNAPMQVPDDPGKWIVNSRTSAGMAYLVDTNANTCTCKDGGRRCWHFAAASVCDEVLTREANGGDLLPQGARDLLAEHDAGDWCATNRSGSLADALGWFDASL